MGVINLYFHQTGGSAGSDHIHEKIPWALRRSSNRLTNYIIPYVGVRVYTSSSFNPLNQPPSLNYTSHQPTHACIHTSTLHICASLYTFIPYILAHIPHHHSQHPSTVTIHIHSHVHIILPTLTPNHTSTINTSPTPPPISTLHIFHFHPHYIFTPFSSTKQNTLTHHISHISSTLFQYFTHTFTYTHFFTLIFSTLFSHTAFITVSKDVHFHHIFTSHIILHILTFTHTSPTIPHLLYISSHNISSHHI